MSVIIPESGMRFGPFDEEGIFRIEKSQLYKSLGESLFCVNKIMQFALSKQNQVLLNLTIMKTSICLSLSCARSLPIPSNFSFQPY